MTVPSVPGDADCVQFVDTDVDEVPELLEPSAQVSGQNVGRVSVEVVAAAVVAPGGPGVPVPSCVLHVLHRGSTPAARASVTKV